MVWYCLIGVLIVCMGPVYGLGVRRGYRLGRRDAAHVLNGFLLNVAWSGSVRDCIRLLEGNETIESLRAAREKRRTP